MKPTVLTAWITPEEVANIRPAHVVQALEWGHLSPSGHYEVKITLVDHEEWMEEGLRRLHELENE